MERERILEVEPDATWRKVKEYAEHFCTAQEIADLLDVSYGTLDLACRRHFGITIGELRERYAATTKLKIRMRLLDAAETDNKILRYVDERNVSGPVNPTAPSSAHTVQTLNVQLNQNNLPPGEHRAVTMLRQIMGKPEPDAVTAKLIEGEYGESTSKPK